MAHEQDDDIDMDHPGVWLRLELAPFEAGRSLSDEKKEALAFWRKAVMRRCGRARLGCAISPRVALPQRLSKRCFSLPTTTRWARAQGAKLWCVTRPCSSRRSNRGPGPVEIYRAN